VGWVKGEYQDGVRALLFVDASRALVTASLSGRITLWDVETGQVRWVLPQQPGVHWLARTPDDCGVVSNKDGQVCMTDLRTGQVTATLGKETDPPSLCGAVSPDGRWLVAGSGEHIRRWDLGTGREESPLVGHLDVVTALAFAPDGHTLASGSKDRTIRLWSLFGWQSVGELEGHQVEISCLTFAQDGQMLISAGGNTSGCGEILSWPAPRPRKPE